MLANHQTPHHCPDEGDNLFHGIQDVELQNPTIALEVAIHKFSSPSGLQTTCNSPTTTANHAVFSYEASGLITPSPSLLNLSRIVYKVAT
jgi:hypothetical protein